MSVFNNEMDKFNALFDEVLSGLSVDERRLILNNWETGTDRESRILRAAFEYGRAHAMATMYRAEKSAG